MGEVSLTPTEYDNACMLFKSGNLKQALEEFNKMAEEYPEAYFRIGQIYHQPSPFLQECAKREGVEPDYRKAVSHYYMAHRLGCDRGLPFLGSILLKGLTGQPNRESAKSILNLGVNSQDKDTALYCRQSLAQF